MKYMYIFIVKYKVTKQYHTQFDGGFKIQYFSIVKPPSAFFQPRIEKNIGMKILLCIERKIDELGFIPTLFQMW